MTDKYRYTAAELFKLRMQFKAQVNQLRKTYNEVVIERGEPQKKHFYSPHTIPVTAIVPEQQRSMHKAARQKRHYSPIFNTPTHEKSSMSCKKQFGNAKSIDNLSKVIAQKCQTKKKSLSQVMLSKCNKTMSNIETKNKTVLPGTYQQLVSTPKTGIKIVPKYHQYDNRFFG